MLGDALARKADNDQSVARRHVEELVAVHSLALTETEQDMVGRYVRDLTRYPSNPTKRLPYRNLTTFAERVEAAQTSDDPNLLSPVTINGKYITPLRQIFVWARLRSAPPGTLKTPQDSVAV